MDDYSRTIVNGSGGSGTSGNGGIDIATGAASAENTHVVFDGTNLDVMFSNASQYDIIHNRIIQTTFCLLYFAIFVLGVFGNVLVCYVVFRNKAMQTVTNLFITNLALSDILLCVLAVPFTPLYTFLRGWIFGSTLCHMVPYAQGCMHIKASMWFEKGALDAKQCRSLGFCCDFVVIDSTRSRLVDAINWLCHCKVSVKCSRADPVRRQPKGTQRSFTSWVSSNLNFYNFSAISQRKYFNFRCRFFQFAENKLR